MADIHVLTARSRGQVDVVLHVPIPVGTNSVGTNWRTALVNSDTGGNTSLTIGEGPGQITQAEADLIASGAIFEHRTTFPLDASTPSGHRAALREFYAKTKTDKLASLQKQLQYFGHVENES